MAVPAALLLLVSLLLVANTASGGVPAALLLLVSLLLMAVPAVGGVLAFAA